MERERAVDEIKRWSWRDDECWIGDALVAIVAGQAKYEDLPCCALQYDGEMKPKDALSRKGRSATRTVTGAASLR